MTPGYSTFGFAGLAMDIEGAISFILTPRLKSRELPEGGGSLSGY